MVLAGFEPTINSRNQISGAFNLIARHLAAPFNKDVTAFMNRSYHHNMVVGNRDDARG